MDLDFMKNKKRDGIAVAGSVLVDKINGIKAYPQSGELTQIINLEKAVGGCVPNVALDLKKICPDIDIKAIGGSFILPDSYGKKGKCSCCYSP